MVYDNIRKVFRRGNNLMMLNTKGKMANDKFWTACLCGKQSLSCITSQDKKKLE